MMFVSQRVTLLNWKLFSAYSEKCLRAEIQHLVTFQAFHSLHFNQLLWSRSPNQKQGKQNIKNKWSTVGNWLFYFPRLTITEKKDYPITTSFPHTLEALQVVGINLKKFDSRILKLRHLLHLDLSDNALTDLPTFDSSLPNLCELVLSGNRIERLNFDFFNAKFAAKLKLLDLSNNLIKVLPNLIANFKQLITLKLDRNQLERLPINLGRIVSLRSLSVSQNKIKALPGSMLKLYMDSVDVSGNPFDEDMGERGGQLVYNNLKFPSLLDLAVITCLSKNIMIKPEDAPSEVRRLMESYLRCQCGKICLSSKAVILVPLSLGKVSSEVISESRDCLFEAVVCSTQCLDKYRDNPFAL